MASRSASGGMRVLLRLTLCAAVASGSACVAAPGEGEGVRYEAAAGWHAGAAEVLTPYGGVYEYSQREASDARSPQRFLLGRHARDEFVLFSAQEEEALWNLRERKRQERENSLEAATADATAGPAATGRAAVRRRHPSIRWPRVIVAGEKTCVPRLEFSESPDWREHLVCWLSGEKRVE